MTQVDGVADEVDRGHQARDVVRPAVDVAELRRLVRRQTAAAAGLWRGIDGLVGWPARHQF